MALRRCTARDALAGVVNFVLKDTFEGIALDFQSGITQEGDAEENRFSALVGMNSPARQGNVMLGVEWYERGIAFQKDRDFYVDGWHDLDEPHLDGVPVHAGFRADRG